VERLIVFAEFNLPPRSLVRFSRQALSVDLNVAVLAALGIRILAANVQNRRIRRPEWAGPLNVLRYVRTVQLCDEADAVATAEKSDSTLNSLMQRSYLSPAILDYVPRKVREVIKDLEKAGWQHVRTRGDHGVFRHSDGGSPWCPASSAMTCGQAPAAQSSDRLESRRSTNEEEIIPAH
jgi:predicted RNA binding protein YcfA (HicA-like mRNA interferase family)